MADMSMLHANEWTVTEIKGAPLTLEANPTLRFSSHQRAGGFGGCNRFNAEYTFTDDGSDDGGGLAFGVISSTMMACPDAQMEVERRLFDALEDVARVSAADARTLILRDEGGAPLVRLAKTG